MATKDWAVASAWALVPAAPEMVDASPPGCAW